MTTTPAIEVTSLPVGAGVLSLVVARGDAVALVGEQQGELTTIVRRCGGLEPIRAGHVVVDGVDVGRASRRALLELYQRVGYVSVQGGLFANLDVLDNLALPLRYRGMAPEAARERGRQRLSSLDLADLCDRRAAELSIEQQKLVAYIRTAMTEPTILLAEDPSAHLSPTGREVVVRLHRELLARGGTCLVADDDRALVEELGATVVEIDAAREVA
jgi:putative ABC transport system ATP-binding protein